MNRNRDSGNGNGRKAEATMPPPPPGLELELTPEVPEEPLVSNVAQGDRVALPRPARRTEPRSEPVARPRGSPKVGARTHGDRSLDVGGRAPAGDAFAAWLRSEKDLDPDQRFGAMQLQELAAEFKARPIHGHRRTGSSGDNHRPNPEHLRR
jgi:hypothetical protein